LRRSVGQNLSRTRDVQQYANRQAKHKAKETRNEGHMLAEMDGSETDTQAAIAWLKENHVKVEVLGYV
jgi:ABC-type methionine transport system ATPase subunit